MPVLQTETGSIHYTFTGNAKGPVVLFSNSLGTDYTLWDSQLPALLPHCRVLRYDTRGHGKSELSEGEYRVEQLGKDVIELLNALGLERVCFCGISMGGLIGQWLAIHFPDRLDKLVLGHTAARIGTVENWNSRIAKVRESGTASIATEVLNRWFTPSFSKTHPEAVQKVRRVFETTSSTGYSACCAAVRDADFRADLHRISAPTLVIAGTEDVATTVVDAQFLAREIPHATLLTIPAAHLGNIEAEAVFSQALIQFLLPRPDLWMNKEDLYQEGMKVRRAVLGDEHVEKATAKVNPFNDDFQHFITRYAWGEIWTRPQLSRHNRSLITLAMLVALNRGDEFRMHVKAALNNGVTVEEIKEVVLQTGIYCGLPAANAAYHLAEEVFQQLGISINHP